MSNRTSAIVQALTADPSPLRHEGVVALIDYLLAQPLADLVDAEAVGDIVIASLTEDNARRYVERHVRPGWERYVAHVEANGDTVGDTVDDASRARIEAIVTGDGQLRGRWLKGAVDPALIRQLLAPILQETLMSFASRLPIPGVGAGATDTRSGGALGGLGRGLAKRAAGLADVGKSMLGGLGAEMERKLQAAARDFSQTAVGSMRSAVQERLDSDEGQRLQREIRKQVYAHVLATRLSDLNEDLARLPEDEIWSVVAPIVAHNARRDQFQGFLRGELAGFFDREGERTVRELLEEAGLLDQVRDAVLERSDAIARGYFASEGFSAWLTKLLEV